MLTLEQNERLTRVGPGTPCGELMRRYWHPVAAVSQMKDRYTMPIRLLGEDLVLYKDRSGTFGLIEPRCPHRRMSLIYGIPLENGIRCPYHGWAFDETGRCIEQPYEETEDPEGRFKDKVKAKAYPVETLAGLVFAYLGPAPAPLLPRWDVYAIDDVVRDIGYAVLDCNWLQCQENSLDPIHVEWLHNDFSNWVMENLGRDDLKGNRIIHEKIGFDVFDYGIIKRRVIQGGSEDDDDWKVGHPIVFPYFLRQGGSGFHRNWGQNGPAFQIRVPLDDTHTGHWWVSCYAKAAEDPEQSDARHPLLPAPRPIHGRERGLAVELPGQQQRPGHGCVGHAGGHRGPHGGEPGPVRQGSHPLPPHAGAEHPHRGGRRRPDEHVPGPRHERVPAHGHGDQREILPGRGTPSARRRRLQVQPDPDPARGRGQVLERPDPRSRGLRGSVLRASAWADEIYDSQARAQIW